MSEHALAVLVDFAVCRLLIEVLKPITVWVFWAGRAGKMIGVLGCVAQQEGRTKCANRKGGERGRKVGWNFLPANDWRHEQPLLPTA